ncbi:transposon Ty3-I Gag-Pol polyprotein [Trichonephila clavipes]|uniref:Transposon Ty3-I Gag-Pol polyprotein n=1 Tax=Trichonephila clavipes TaxID=2585209 RepID=A0A8X6V1K4_TRICX|nr:transposon Ty3-I Gag-Pol polyprotein [Trichonephila clavipes]
MTLDTMLPFCPNDFDDNNITKIAARAEESRQLARVHTLRAQDKDRRRYDSKHQMVSYAPGDLVWVYTPVRKVGLSEKLLRSLLVNYEEKLASSMKDLLSTEVKLDQLKKKNEENETENSNLKLYIQQLEVSRWKSRYRRLIGIALPPI